MHKKTTFCLKKDNHPILFSKLKHHLVLAQRHKQCCTQIQNLNPEMSFSKLTQKGIMKHIHNLNHPTKISQKIFRTFLKTTKSPIQIWFKFGFLCGLRNRFLIYYRYNIIGNSVFIGWFSMLKINAFENLLKTYFMFKSTKSFFVLPI